jgi:hypothetical protein
MGTLPKFGTVGWSALQMLNLDFPEPGIGGRQQSLPSGSTGFSFAHVHF